MKIIVAEDDLDNARLLESILKKNAHTVEVVGDGKEALKRLRGERFDALLTDWMMPEMDGVTLIQRVWAEVETAPFILMVTAVGDDDSRQKMLQTGADDFLIIREPKTAAYSFFSNVFKILGKNSGAY